MYQTTQAFKKNMKNAFLGHRHVSCVSPGVCVRQEFVGVGPEVCGVRAESW